MGRALNRARLTERRHSPRRSGEALSWIREFHLRPRLDATLVNLSEEGAVVETSAYLCPGVRTFIHLAGPCGVWRVSGQVARSWVTSLWRNTVPGMEARCGSIVRSICPRAGLRPFPRARTVGREASR